MMRYITSISSGNISSICSSNSEANASELLENIEEMFLGTTCMVMSVTILNHPPPHNNILFVAKEMKNISCCYRILTP